MYYSPYYYPRYEYHHCCYVPPVYYYRAPLPLYYPEPKSDSIIDRAFCDVLRHVGTGENEIETARQNLSLESSFDAHNAFCAISRDKKYVTAQNLIDYMQNKDLTLSWAE